MPLVPEGRAGVQIGYSGSWGHRSIPTTIMKGPYALPVARCSVWKRKGLTQIINREESGFARKSISYLDCLVMVVAMEEEGIALCSHEEKVGTTPFDFKRKRKRKVLVWY